ncbi:MAG: shikimate kinase [Gaiellaceae bacterium]
MRRVAIVASASGNGKTTLGRELARRLDVPFVETDALVHGPNWVETPDDELRARLQPVLDSDGWVIDGTYRGKLGDLVLEHANIVVWLDLPVRVWFPRLLRRTIRRVRGRERLWNDNTESLRSAFWGRESLFGFALRMHFERRRRYPIDLAAFRVVRLRSPPEVAAWLDGYSSSAINAAARVAPPESTGA